MITDIRADIARLCALVDQGDDSALPILADALEEAGDSRAWYVRECMGPGRHCPDCPPGHDQPGWCVIASGELWELIFRRWRAGDLRGLPHPRCCVWQKAPGGATLRQKSPAGMEWHCYPTRSAAFLALAEVMSR